MELKCSSSWPLDFDMIQHGQSWQWLETNASESFAKEDTYKWQINGSNDKIFNGQVWPISTQEPAYLSCENDCYGWIFQDSAGSTWFNNLALLKCLLSNFSKEKKKSHHEQLAWTYINTSRDH